MDKIAKLRAAKAAALDVLYGTRKTAMAAWKALADKPAKDFKPEDQTEIDRLNKEVGQIDVKLQATAAEYDTEIKRAVDFQDAERVTSLPIPGQESHQRSLPAEPNNDPYTSKAAAKAQGLTTNKGLIAVGMAKAMYMGGYVPQNGIAMAKSTYGEGHPVTEALGRGFETGQRKALAAGIGPSGGFIVPPDYVNEIIELLRPRAVVRAANPRSMPMPRGTMTLPSQTAAASANYGSETGKIAASQQQLGDIVASYKKLTALVPVTNDLMRYASPAADAFVRDDLTKVIALREDLAFLTGDGTADSPKGFLGFANNYVANGGGTVGKWLATGNSTYASGGNFITSNESYSLTTVANELGGLVNKLDAANVPDIKRRWFFNPRIFNYLNNLLNSLGVYVYRDELGRGTLLGYPFSKTTQIPVNLYDTTGAQTTGTFIFLVEMDDAILLDSMSLELAVSREGTYYDTTGTLQSAFQKDQTLIRAIAEHDFQMRHLPSIAVDQGVIWAPALS
jgi:HK97 family phage major capsid protein